MRRNPAGTYLLSQGFRRLDYYNKAILARPEAVLTSILDAIGGGETGIELALPPTPLPSPPQQRGREQ